MFRHKLTPIAPCGCGFSNEGMQESEILFEFGFGCGFSNEGMQEFEIIIV